MHLQAAVEDFDVFARSLSIGAETMVMHFEPDRPMYDRYQVDHDFLSPETGDEVVTISRLVNAFFRWEFNSCETIVKDGVASPIDYANASPDVALTSLHYYFPWAIRALVRWSAFCLATGRPMRINQTTRDYFDDRRPRRPLVRGEAGRVPASSPTPTSRSTRTTSSAPSALAHLDEALHRVGRGPRLRRPARRHGHVDLPAARARALRRPLPRPARGVGARRRGGAPSAWVVLCSRVSWRSPRAASVGDERLRNRAALRRLAACERRPHTRPTCRSSTSGMCTSPAVPLLDLAVSETVDRRYSGGRRDRSIGFCAAVAQTILDTGLAAVNLLGVGDLRRGARGPARLASLQAGRCRYLSERRLHSNGTLRSAIPLRRYLVLVSCARCTKTMRYRDGSTAICVSREYTLERTQVVAVPIEEAFAFFADAAQPRADHAAVAALPDRRGARRAATPAPGSATG